MYCSMLDLAGKLIGDFEIETLLGKGSMAQVYRAWQVSLRRAVALKVLEEEIFTPDERIQRFLREAEALARLEHPHIVPIYAAGEEAPYYYFAMRLVPGGTLAGAMQRGVRRSAALAWARQTCQALAYAHASGVVHRDLKPTNILLHDDVALLADFGLARLRDLSTLTHHGLILGTPLYMAPEQTLGRSADPAADCFALGVLLYQLFTGEHPFTDIRKAKLSTADQTSLFQRIQKAEFQPPSKAMPGFPAAIETVILRALARRPEDRYADAGAMLEELEAAGEAFEGEESVIHSMPPAREEPVTSETQVLPRDAGPGEATPPATRSSTVPPASMATPLTVFGRYEVLGELGHGGQGIVYRARDPVLDRHVALKVLQGGWKADHRLIDLFTKEAQVAASLNHPHIIPILDFGLEDESPYLTMPVVEGPSLDRLIAEGRPLAVPFAFQVLVQTADALAFAHDAGILHLDIKPGNLLIRKSSRHASHVGLDLYGGLGFPHVILTDFTMARVRQAEKEDVQAERLTSGTIPYASPEQLEDNRAALGPASDIFSLGVVLHEMLTGQRLFAGDDPSVTQTLVLHANVPPPSARVPGLPPEVDELCLHMLRRRPEDRFASAADVVAAGEKVLERVKG